MHVLVKKSWNIYNVLLLVYWKCHIHYYYCYQYRKNIVRKVTISSMNTPNDIAPLLFYWRFCLFLQVVFLHIFIYIYLKNQNITDKQLRCSSNWSCCERPLDKHLLLPPLGYFLPSLFQDGVERRRWGARMDSGGATAPIGFVHRLRNEGVTSTRRLYRQQVTRLMCRWLLYVSVGTR